MDTIINATVFRKGSNYHAEGMPAPWRSFDRQPQHASMPVDRYRASDPLQMFYALRHLCEVRDGQGYTRHIESKRGMNGVTYHTWRFVKDGHAEVIEFRTQ